MTMKKRSRIITVIAICGVAILLLLISQYRNLNAESDVEKAKEQFVYQAKGKKMPRRNQGNSEKYNAGKDASAHSKNSDTNRDKESKGDADFYRVIVENNLFRPLGWQRPNREPQYALIATLIGSERGFAKAFIMERRSNQHYYVSVGEKVGNAVIKRIKSNEVVLYEVGKRMTIRAESSQFLSGSGGKGGEPPPSNRENRPDRNSDNRGDKQPNLNGMKNRFQNASPEEIQRMKEEFRRSQGNKKTGGDQSKGGEQSKGKGQSKSGGEIRGK